MDKFYLIVNWGSKTVSAVETMEEAVTSLPGQDNVDVYPMDRDEVYEGSLESTCGMEDGKFFANNSPQE